jgi:Zn-dependent protease
VPIETPVLELSRVQPAKNRSGSAGPWGLMLTLGLKLSKIITVTKAALFAASFGAYAVLFSWQFAALVLTALFVHENGHIWAMKRCGMKTRGIYFIPFFGGAAVSDSAFRTRRDEVFVAIMGPIWGLSLAILVGGLYVITRDPIWAAAAGWMAFINLFNLFPVNPLDGGRIVKSLAFSLHSWLGIGIMGAGFLGALFLAYWFGFGLLIFIVFLGGAEFVAEVRARQRGNVARAALRRLEIMASFGGYVGLIVLLLGFMVLMRDQPGAGLALHILQT